MRISMDWGVSFNIVSRCREGGRNGASFTVDEGPAGAHREYADLKNKGRG